MSNLSREAGILMPIFSLPSKYGIGDLGKEAYRFIDFLKESNQRYWQILPIGPTSYGDSPYQSFSSFAGNPYFIDLDELVNEGLLSNSDLVEFENNTKFINYEWLYQTRFNLLRKAFERYDINNLNEFISSNKEWLIPYASFMVLKDKFNGKAFYEWPNEFKFYNEEFINNYLSDYQNDVNFYIFVQKCFYKQWFKLKEYANLNNVKIIGDMPIYVSLDSCDVWCNPTEFLLDKELKPTMVAGCPPDQFTEDGQLWGNPLYNWPLMKKEKYSWWVKRLSFSSKIFDVIRIDHFRGFEAFYAIPYGDKNARRGKWMKGPNAGLFKLAEEKLGKLDIIVENLGFITPSVEKMLEKVGYPGMKVLEFGFSVDGMPLDATYNLTYNNVCYATTHDNAPVLAWFKSLDENTKIFIRDYLYLKDDSQICNVLIRRCLESACKISILSMWDIVQGTEEARINTPSTLGLNWKWRADFNDINNDTAKYLNYLMHLYKRNN